MSKPILSTDVPLPAHFRQLIDEERYRVFLQKCLFILNELGVDVVNIGDGTIGFRNEAGEDNYFALDNVLRRYVSKSGNAADAEIRGHFSGAMQQMNAYIYLYKDYDFSRKLLRVMVKPQAEQFEELVHRTDYPNLYTVLAIDFKNQFHYVRRDLSEQWGVSQEELFRQAFENMTCEKFVVKRLAVEGLLPTFGISTDYYAGAFTLMLDGRKDIEQGRFGCVVALPSSSMAFVLPVENAAFMENLRHLLPVVTQAYNQMSGPISREFYWYFRGRFERFEYVPKLGGGTTVRAPNYLRQMLLAHLQ